MKLAVAEGATAPDPANQTSTLSMRSVYARESGAGIPDREPIRPPQEKEKGWGTALALVASVLTIIVTVVGIAIFVTTLKNRVDFNEKSLDRLSASFSQTDKKREELGERISKLEQWNNIFSRDLEELRRDIDSGLSNEQLEIKLRDLENRIYERMADK